MFVSFNHQIISASGANLPALSSAALYGAGVFTTIAIYHRKPFQWQKHWQRLTENAARLNVRLPVDFTEETVLNSLAKLAEENNLTTGRARITFFDEAGGGAWTAFEHTRRASLLITTDEFRPAPEELRLTLSPYRINSKSALAGVKSCNYLENLIALEEARSRQCDEAVRLNENGEIASAAMANLFWVNDETIFTPALETGCLEGTTRAFAIELAKELGLEVYTTAEHFDVLRLADEIFLTSTGLGIAKVRNLDGETYGDEITRRLQKNFFAKTER